jgi:hypothetical protein
MNPIQQLIMSMMARGQEPGGGFLGGHAGPGRGGRFLIGGRQPDLGRPDVMGGPGGPGNPGPLEAPAPGSLGGQFEAPYPGSFGGHAGPGRGGRFIETGVGQNPGGGGFAPPPHGDPLEAPYPGGLPRPPHIDPPGEIGGGPGLGGGIGGGRENRFERRMAYRADQGFHDPYDGQQVDNGSGGYRSSPAYRPGFDPRRYEKINGGFLGQRGQSMLGAMHARPQPKPALPLMGGMRPQRRAFGGL